MSCGRRVKNAGADIRNVYLVRRELQTVHKLHGCAAPALYREGYNSGAAERKILFHKRIIFISFKPRVEHCLNLCTGFKIFCYCNCVLNILLHSHGERLQSEIEQERRVRRRIAAEISHKLHSCLYDIGSCGVFLGINNSVIALVRLGQTREFSACLPVEFSGIDYDASYLYRVTVHIFRGAVDNYIGSPFDRSAKVRCREGIVYDQRNALLVRSFGEFFYVKDGKSGICDSFTENKLRIILERSSQFLLSAVRVNENTFDAQLFQREAEKIDSSAVYRGR